MFDPCKNVKRYRWRNLITDVSRGFSKLRLRGLSEMSAPLHVEKAVPAGSGPLAVVSAPLGPAIPRDHLRGRLMMQTLWNAAVAGHFFLGPPVFPAIDTRPGPGGDSLGDGAGEDRTGGFNGPLGIEAFPPAAHRVFGAAIGALESSLHQQVPKPGSHVG